MPVFRLSDKIAMIVFSVEYFLRLLCSSGTPQHVLDRSLPREDMSEYASEPNITQPSPSPRRDNTMKEDTLFNGDDSSNILTVPLKSNSKDYQYSRVRTNESQIELTNNKNTVTT